MLGKVDGLLLDLGVSSPQLDTAMRGFSFQSDGPLDMRMDPSKDESAAHWIATVEERTLKRVLQQFGEERFSGRIARAIVAARSATKIESTAQLAEIVRQAVPARGQKRHPATKTFQAIRIFINRRIGRARACTGSIHRVAAPGRAFVRYQFSLAGGSARQEIHA